MLKDQDKSQPRKRRGRPPNPDKVALTERSILDAATELFVTRGYADTSMDDIARNAKVAKGTLYNYYPTKSALLETVLKTVFAGPILKTTIMPMAEGETVQAFLRRVVVPLLRQGKTSQREGILRLMLSEGARHPDLGEMYRRVVLDAMHAFLRQLAERAYKGGEFRSGTDGLIRFPLILFSPLLMASAWNGLHDQNEQISAASAFEAMLDLIFVNEH